MSELNPYKIKVLLQDTFTRRCMLAGNAECLLQRRACHNKCTQYFYFFFFFHYKVFPLQFTCFQFWWDRIQKNLSAVFAYRILRLPIFFHILLLARFNICFVLWQHNKDKTELYWNPISLNGEQCEIFAISDFFFFFFDRIFSCSFLPLVCRFAKTTRLTL